MKTIVLSLLLGTFAVLAAGGCDRGTTVSKDPEKPAAPAAVLPSGLMADAAPANAKGVVELKGSVKDGDEVVVRGVVGGREDPVSETQAIVTLLDAAVTTCDKMEGDACKTPWDACCEADLPAKTATVQVVGSDGKPLKGSLAASGVKPLKQIVVAGKARLPGDGKALVIEATRIHVVP